MMGHFEAEHRRWIEESTALIAEMLPSRAEEIEEVRAEYQEDPSRSEEWQRAEKPSQEWRRGVFFEEALRVLSVALSRRPRHEVWDP